jgi:hypothetical protein
MKTPLSLVLALSLTYSINVVAEDLVGVPEDAKEYVPAKPASFSSYVPYALDYRPGWFANSFLFLSPELAKKAEVSRESPKSDMSVRFPLKNRHLTINYDGGASHDPGFSISFESSKDPIIIGGEILYVSPAGSFYVVTRSNENFEVKRKFMLSENSLIEIRQPYYYVNDVCKTSSNLVMYEKICEKGDIVAKIPEGEDITILLNAMDTKCEKTSDLSEGQYLVATSFGLVGWVVSTHGYLGPGKPLSCLSYLGD